MFWAEEDEEYSEFEGEEEASGEGGQMSAADNDQSDLKGGGEIPGNGNDHDTSATVASNNTAQDTLLPTVPGAAIVLPTNSKEHTESRRSPPEGDSTSATSAAEEAEGGSGEHQQHSGELEETSTNPQEISREPQESSVTRSAELVGAAETTAEITSVVESSLDSPSALALVEAATQEISGECSKESMCRDGSDEPSGDYSGDYSADNFEQVSAVSMSKAVKSDEEGASEEYSQDTTAVSAETSISAENKRETSVNTKFSNLAENKSDTVTSAEDPIFADNKSTSVLSSAAGAGYKEGRSSDGDDQEEEDNYSEYDGLDEEKSAVTEMGNGEGVSVFEGVSRGEYELNQVSTPPTEKAEDQSASDLLVNNAQLGTDDPDPKSTLPEPAAATVETEPLCHEHSLEESKDCSSETSIVRYSTRNPEIEGKSETQGSSSSLLSSLPTTEESPETKKERLLCVDSPDN